MGGGLTPLQPKSRFWGEITWNYCREGCWRAKGVKIPRGLEKKSGIFFFCLWSYRAMYSANDLAEPTAGLYGT